MLTPKTFFLLLTVAFIWGVNPLVNKLFLEYGTSTTFMSIRYTLSAFTLFSYMMYKKSFKLPSLNTFCIYALLGILAVPLTMYCSIQGLVYSTVTKAALINSISPIIISLAAFILFRENLYFLQWVGIILVSLSTTFLVTDGMLLELFAIQYNKGDLLFLFAQLSWATYTLVSSRMLKKTSLIDMAFWVSLVGGGASLFVGFIDETLAIPTINIQSILILCFSTWVNSTLAILIWNYGVKNAGSQISSIFINLSTVIGVFCGVYFLGEELTQAVIFGSLGIILGVIMLTQYKFFLWIYQKSLFWNNKK